MIAWEHAAANVERATDQHAALLDIGVGFDPGECIECPARLLVNLAKPSAVPLERFLQDDTGPLSVASGMQHDAERVERLQGVGMFGPELAALLRQGLLERRSRRRVLTARVVNQAEHLFEPRPDLGGALQPCQGAHLCAAEKLADRHPVAVGTHRRIRRFEQLDEHADHLLGLGLLASCTVALGGHPRRLDDGHDAESGEQTHEHHGARHDQPIPADELANPVAQGRGPGEDRVALEVALEILGHRVHGRVPLVGLFLERLEDDGVEIAAQQAPHRGIGGHVARPTRIDAQDRLVEREPRAAREAVRALAREQLVEEDAERVHVGGDAERLTGQLFRRGVVGREGTAGHRRDRGRFGAPLSDQLGDAEVQQLHVPCIGDENVRRLQIAVDHQLRVGVGDGARHLQEDAQARVDEQALRLDVFVDRAALDVLEREVGLSHGRHARVVEPGDVRVAEARQDLAFARHAVGETRQTPGASRQFQRHWPVQQAVSALGEVHLAHAAARELADDPIRSDAEGIVRTRRRDVVSSAIGVLVVRPIDLGNRAEHGDVRPGRVVQETPESRPDVRIPWTQVVDRTQSIRGRQIEHLVEEMIQEGQGLDVHVAHVRRALRAATRAPSPSRAGRYDR